MANEEVLKERERDKGIIVRKFDEVIEHRKKTIKRKINVKEGIFKKLKRDILFLVDNPDYVRVKKQ